MIASVTKMLEKWGELIGERDEFEMDVHKEFYKLAGEVSSRTTFRSNFEKGMRIFELQQQQKSLSYKALQNVYIPGFRACEEVLQVCNGSEYLTAENLPELKIVDMIIKETLRLYPPDNIITRKTMKNIKVGNLNIPAKTELYMPQTVVHRDTEIRGRVSKGEGSRRKKKIEGKGSRE
ncbi:hypothetical protein AgCh_038498 [Apium graveolens]